MSATQDIAPPKVRWDLSSLFSGIDDPKIDRTWSEGLAAAERFEQAYRGKINSPDLTASTLASALKEIEALLQETSKPIIYAQLVFSTDTGDPKVGSFLQKQMEKHTELNVKVMFFELELQSAPQDVLEKALQDPALENYRHYVRLARTFSPYRMSEKEEIILEETANTGIRAWQRLFDEIVSNHEFKVRNPETGEVETQTLEETVNQLRDPNRTQREAAGEALTKGLKELERVLVFTYNNLLLDKRIEDRLRKYEYPEHSRHLANELDRETVDLVIRLCREHYPLVARFYSVKREILGLPELTHIDRYAPLFETKEKVPYERARQIVVEAFGSFSEPMADKADEFFRESWIDAEPRPGKQGGAFCSPNTPDVNPVVFMNYLNKMDDVMTLAHELGHGVHSSFSRKQSFFNYMGTLPLAELASTFGEMLVFEKLLQTASDKDKVALYAEKIEGIFATVFRQAAMFSFEQRCHETRRAEGELAPEDFGDIWQEELQAMFGESLKLGEDHRCWWSYVSHFISVPFYVYAYSFGELLVLSLYQMAKNEGPAFAVKYIGLLEAGGSETPHELMARVGVDLRSEEFWNGGFVAMEKLVAEFERLWNGVKSV